MSYGCELFRSSVVAKRNKMEVKKWIGVTSFLSSSPLAPYCSKIFLKIPIPFRFHCVRTGSRRWDSNAEFVRTPRFNVRFRFRDVDDDVGDVDDDEDEFPIDWERRFVKVLDKVTDDVYVFKVFKSYGWFLPPILLSLLITTGPKAFLLALALALGLSALYLAFDKLVGVAQVNANHTTRRKRKQAKKVRGRARKQKMGYQSWVARNDGSVDNIPQDAPSFSGWDELDDRTSYNMRSMRNMDRTTGGSRRLQMENGKLMRSEKRSETPLLLRLLLGVFPFLSSWTKLLL